MVESVQDKSTVSTVKFNFSLYKSVGFAVIAGLAFGYDLGVISGAETDLQKDLKLNDDEFSLIVSAAKFGAILGVILGSILFDVIGRQKSLTFTGFLYLIGPIFICFSQGILPLLAGRFFVGVGIGASVVVVVAYLGEISPPSWRGAIVTSVELALAMGGVLSIFIDYFLGSNWRLMMLLPGVFGAILLFSPLILPESPRWLVTQKRFEEAINVLIKLNNCSAEESEAEVKVLSREYEKDLQMEISRNELESHQIDKRSGVYVFILRQFRDLKSLCKGRESAQFRTVLFLALVNQLCGSTSIINYASKIFVMSGVEDKGKRTLFTGFITLSKCIGVISGMYMVDRIGRRPILMYGSLSSAVSLLLLGISVHLSSPVLSVTFVCLFMFSFASSHASVFAVLASEVFSMRFKRIALASSYVCLFIAGTIADSTFLVMLENFGPIPTFFSLFSVMISGYIIVRGELPETKNLNLSQVRNLFSRSAESKKYCFGFTFIHWNSRLRSAEEPQKDDFQESVGLNMVSLS